MRPPFYAGAFIAALLGAMAAFSLPAHAADINGRQTYDTPSYVAPTLSWTGFYIGGSIGYGNANHDLTVQRYNGAYCFDKFKTNGVGERDDVTIPGYQPDGKDWAVAKDGFIRNIPEGGCVDGEGDLKHDEATIDPSSKDVANLDGLNSHGLVGGVQIGADYQIGRRFVVGVFGSYDLASMKTEGNIGDFASFEIEKGDEWSIGGRLGLLVHPTTMVYALAAYTQTEYDFSARLGTEGGKRTVDFDGVTVGGGIEFAVTNNVFLGAEYRHTFYGEETILDSGASPVGGFGTRLVDDLDEDKIMATLKIKLNAGLGY